MFEGRCSRQYSKTHHPSPLCKLRLIVSEFSLLSRISPCQVVPRLGRPPLSEDLPTVIGILLIVITTWAMLERLIDVK